MKLSRAFTGEYDPVVTQKNPHDESKIVPKTKIFVAIKDVTGPLLRAESREDPRGENCINLQLY